MFTDSMSGFARFNSGSNAWPAVTLEALADVEAGRVVEGEKVLDWLDSWGSDDELAPPR